VSSLVGTFPKTKWAQIPRENFLCECCSHLLLLGRTVRIRTVRTTRREGTIFEATSWHENRGCLVGFLVVVGPYCAGRTTYCWHGFLGTVFEEAVQLYGFGHEFQDKILWGTVWCCEVFFLAGNCEFVADMYFPEAE
jgi:hypothetical protein